MKFSAEAWELRTGMPPCSSNTRTTTRAVPPDLFQNPDASWTSGMEINTRRCFYLRQ